METYQRQEIYSSCGETAGSQRRFEQEQAEQVVLEVRAETQHKVQQTPRACGETETLKNFISETFNVINAAKRQTPPKN